MIYVLVWHSIIHNAGLNTAAANSAIVYTDSMPSDAAPSDLAKQRSKPMFIVMKAKKESAHIHCTQVAVISTATFEVASLVIHKTGIACVLCIR